MSAVHVLIVEDDDATREVLVDLLTDAGYTVFEAPDGKPALERLRAYPEGMVVLLDWMMPGTDGLAVLQAVAAESPLAKRHRYILMSATGPWLPAEMSRLLKQLNVSMIAKPFDVDEMLSAVQEAASHLPESPI